MKTDYRQTLTDAIANINKKRLAVGSQIVLTDNGYGEIKVASKETIFRDSSRGTGKPGDITEEQTQEAYLRLIIEMITRGMFPHESIKKLG